MSLSKNDKYDNLLFNGDVLSFQMPYSKLSFTLTYKEFSRPDVAKDDEKALLSDYPIEQENALQEFYRLI